MKLRSVLLCVALLLASDTEAYAGDWNPLKAVGRALKKAGDAGISLVKSTVKVASTIIVGLAEDAAKQVKDVVTDPVGFFRRDLPSRFLETATKLFNLGAQAAEELIAGWVGRPECKPGEVLAALRSTPVEELSEAERQLGFVTTLGKRFSRLILPNTLLGDNTIGWTDTGCSATGVGRLVRDAQRSTDGFWTLDVALEGFIVDTSPSVPGRYIRLEVQPSRPAHWVCENSALRSGDRIWFSGPVLWDHAKFLEVHPAEGFQAIRGNAVGQLPSALSEPSSHPDPNSYTVMKGDCLATIAARYYGRQFWLPIHKANKLQIKNPDLIYPGQLLYVPALGNAQY
jgi:nucleoid-associated protein YgaU